MDVCFVKELLISVDCDWKLNLLSNIFIDFFFYQLKSLSTWKSSTIAHTSTKYSLQKNKKSYTIYGSCSKKSLKYIKFNNIQLYVCGRVEEEFHSRSENRTKVILNSISILNTYYSVLISSYCHFLCTPYVRCAVI